jgi:hypothetical protein
LDATRFIAVFTHADDGNRISIVISTRILAQNRTTLLRVRSYFHAHLNPKPHHTFGDAILFPRSS